MRAHGERLASADQKLALWCCRMRILISALLGLWAALASAADKPVKVLEPKSQWVVDYADNNCRLIRMFGADKEAIKLVFEQTAPRSPMTVMLVGSSVSVRQ